MDGGWGFKFHLPDQGFRGSCSAEVFFSTILSFSFPLPKLGTPVVPFCPFYFGVSLLKQKSRKKGTLIIKGLLGNLEKQDGLAAKHDRISEKLFTETMFSNHAQPMAESVTLDPQRPSVLGPYSLILYMKS